MQKTLSEEQLKFIFENKGKMRIKDIAAALGVTDSCVAQRLNPKANIVVMKDFFDIDKEAKMWGI